MQIKSALSPKRRCLLNDLLTVSPPGSEHSQAKRSSSTSRGTTRFASLPQQAHAPGMFLWTSSNHRGSHQVSTIKEKVEEKEGIPPVQQRLIFGGKQM